MTTTVQPSTTLDEVAVERYLHLLATKTYEQLHDLAVELAYVAAFDEDPNVRALARARLPLVHDAADRTPEGKAAERRRMVWCVCAGLERSRAARDWVLAERPSDGGTPFWAQQFRRWEPALAYDAFHGLVLRTAANHHRLVLKEAGK